mmetsp:Transcript_113956/g.157882  ORF Transcript_113956/g.157882 Transcript_113956/m.157882 type:complete len:204 (+) Transcript_113956:610-1221(+)
MLCSTCGTAPAMAAANFSSRPAFWCAATTSSGSETVSLSWPSKRVHGPGSAGASMVLVVLVAVVMGAVVLVMIVAVDVIVVVLVMLVDVEVMVVVLLVLAVVVVMVVVCVVEVLLVVVNVEDVAVEVVVVVGISSWTLALDTEIWPLDTVPMFVTELTALVTLAARTASFPVTAASTSARVTPVEVACVISASTCTEPGERNS